VKDKDIVRWVLDRLLAHDPSITEELTLTVERETRAEWGGQEVRIWKTSTGRVGRPPRTPYDQAKAYADGVGTDTTTEILGKHGISRATLYRLVKRGPGEPR